MIALYNSAGTLFARYEYDAWGKLLSVKDSSGNAITDSSNFAIINSIRYRGYYYDNESGLYYLQSRYYDPTTGRFVNADKFEYLGASDNIKSYNLFAYCSNNPIMKLDFNGCDAIVAAWTFGTSNAWNLVGWIALGVAATLTVVVVGIGISQTIYYYKEHRSNARKSTEQKHQYGDARRKRDQGGEKKKQKNDWKGRSNKRNSG